MKTIYLLIGLTCLFANELEVEGSLKVSGGVDVQGNVISNVGDPVNPSDAVNMNSVGGVVSNILSLAGMEPPERIYRYANNETAFSFTVPDGKIWHIFINRGYLKLGSHDGNLLGDSSLPSSYICLPNDIIISYSNNTTPNNKVAFNIYEYSFTSSGTDQGMDYIVP